MKKKNVINLIRYHQENNEPAFRAEALIVAKDFFDNGDNLLGDYVMSLLSDANYFIPQEMVYDLKYLKKIVAETTTLPLPRALSDDLTGVLNAIKNHNYISKFLFEGPPGTGKTESVKQIARILDRELYTVDFNCLIDSKLGQTQKNISDLFDEIRMMPNIDKCIILFDEIDAIVLDRVNSNDLREMGRVTSAFLKELDEVDERVIIIATTNLYNNLDKAIKRRFDATISFDRYSNDDLIEVAEAILDKFLPRFKNASKNSRLFKKILKLYDKIPYPGELKNIIRTSLAFSSPDNPFDYLKRMYNTVLLYDKKDEYSILELNKLGFTTREIEILTGTSKSNVARIIKEEADEQNIKVKGTVQTKK